MWLTKVINHAVDPPKETNGPVFFSDDGVTEEELLKQVKKRTWLEKGKQTFYKMELLSVENRPCEKVILGSYADPGFFDAPHPPTRHCYCADCSKSFQD